MKGLENRIFWLVLIVSFCIGYFIFDRDFDDFSDVVTFLSIMIGFKISSFAILFNSPLRKALFDRKNKLYKTELHRLKDYYKHALYFEVISIVFIFLLPSDVFALNCCRHTLVIGKHLLITPIIIGTVFCFYKICKDLFEIFTYPTND